MAAGIPTVISRKIDSVEVLKDGKTAMFVDPMSPDQIAERIGWLVEHPKAYTTIAAEGRSLLKRFLRGTIMRRGCWRANRIYNYQFKI